MSSSMTPFLYQTRTLSTTTRTKVKSFHNAKYRHLTPKLFSSATQRWYAGAYVNHPQKKEGSDGQVVTIRRIEDTRDPNPTASKGGNIRGRRGYGMGSQDDKTSNRRISEYRNQSRETYKESSSIGKAASGRDLDVEDVNNIHFTRSDEIDFDEVPGTDEYALSKDEIADLTRPSPVRESTITDTERYAFQKIFSDIFGRQRHIESGHRDAYGDELQSSNGNPQANVAKTPQKPDIIFSGTMQTQRQPATRREMEILVNKFPSALRAAAAKAIGLADAEATEAEFHDPASTNLANQNLETLREPERTRVEALMKAAKTDFELWEIMEKEVFSLIPKLGLGDPLDSTVQVPDDGAKKTIGQRSSKKKKKMTTIENTNSNTRNEKSPKQTEPLPPDTSTAAGTFTISENGISPLALYGPLYPSYILLGIRLLDRSFTKSSPLTLSILPTIKSLGLISQVLGASTQLYNELIRIQRFRYDDYRSILKLLNEMENSGLEYDEETFEIVRDIHRAQHRVREGLEGAAVRALWSLPEFAPNKFQIWLDKIGMAIEEKTQHGGI